VPATGDELCRPPRVLHYQAKPALWRKKGVDPGKPTDIITVADGKSATPSPGAIGFDWIAAGKGGVPWLISWPRKKLIKKQLLKSNSLWLPN